MHPSDFEKQIEQFRTRYAVVEKELADPDVYTTPAKATALSRERTHLEDLFHTDSVWRNGLQRLAENDELLKAETDVEFRQMIEQDIAQLKKEIEDAENRMLLLLIPPDHADSHNAIVEIKPAAGGEEAALFAAELFRMYTKYAEQRGWKCEVLDMSQSGIGGIKNVMFQLNGTDIFSRMKFESGVHRVQRVPVTEAIGRIHTSTVTVSVLPEADELDDIVIRPEDLEITTCRASGAGGQHVNKTDSAVRMHHIPSGIVVASQQERSQIRNREICLRVLRSRLLELSRNEEAAKHAESKRLQVGTGDRSERIRTYNFPQNRVTDHRFGVVSVYDLPGLMEGNLDSLLEPLFLAHSKMVIAELLK